jgi:hypothetical protein
MHAMDDRLVAIGDALERGVRGAVLERHARRRRLRLIAVAACAIAATAGSAIAASSLLGGPAPGPVQSAIDAFYPANDDALAPVPNGSAVAVATSGDDVLYRVPAKDGASTCLVVVLADPTRANAIPGEGCQLRGPLDGALPIGVVSESTGDGRRLVYGQVGVPRIVSLSFESDGAGAISVPIGVDGFFLFERPIDDRVGEPDPRLVPFGVLVLRDASGAEVARRQLHLLSRVPASPSSGRRSVRMPP